MVGAGLGHVDLIDDPPKCEAQISQSKFKISNTLELGAGLGAVVEGDLVDVAGGEGLADLQGLTGRRWAREFNKVRSGLRLQTRPVISKGGVGNLAALVETNG